MPDKQLLRLLGEDKRYIYRAVLWMLTGSLCSICFTACLCYGLQLLFVGAKASFYPLPFGLGAVCAAVRFLATTRAAAVRGRLGRSVKKSLRAQLYAKLLRLGVRETKTVKMAGLTQLATEGIEQLDLYYSSYLPQFFYAMLSPLLLFGICVFLNWRVAAEFFLPLRAFGSAFHVAMNGISAGRMMLTLLEEPEPTWGKAQPCGGRLELEDVHFSYAPGRETLHGVSAVFPERGMTAIVGESGCGKTTVAKLLTGALRPGSGRVLLNGKPVESLDRQAYYASLAHVSCETFLFYDTIRANFLLANPRAAEEEMWRALALVRLDGLVRERGGLDFVLNEDAADISGGQKQRLALAVNLTATKRIYIFDEATGNIDAESEGIIMEVIRSLSIFAGVTVITHRLANVVAADSILYMEGGRICELNKKAYVHIEDWRNRPLQGGHYPYVYVDGIYLRRNWGGEYENVAVLVAIAVNEDGFREVLGAAEGMKEDKASWVSFFQWLRGRGLDGVKLIVGDKCMGMLEAVGEVFPDAKYQRCTVHFYRNVFSVVPKSKVKIVAKMLKAIHAQESKKASREKAKAVVAELRAMKLKEAAKKVEDGIEETLTYCDFPGEHWTRIRTNNVIERLNREIRRRTRVVGTFPDGNSALMLVCARLRHVAGTQWGSKKYMNMKHLEAALDDASIAG